MKIVAEKTKYHRFAFYYDYNTQIVDFCRSLKDAFGWQHFSFEQEGTRKRWVFSQIPILETIVRMYPQADVDPQVRLMLLNESREARDHEERLKLTEKIRTLTDTDFRVKGLKGEPYPYQNVGMQFIDAANGRTIVADAPGVGKTLQALGYAVHRKFTRILVICPSTVKPSWETEVKKWTNMKSYILTSKTKEKDIPADAEVWICNYDILKKHINMLTKVRFDYIVGDEAHMIKNPTAIRTKAFRLISKHIPHVVLLTGTPLLSRPVELFSLLNIIDPKNWNNYYDYTRRYCDAKRTRFGLDVSGVSNPDELHEKIRTYFIRRRKEDVLSQLPPKNHIKFPVDLSPDAAAMYEEAESNLATFLMENKGKKAAEVAKTMQAEKLARLNVLRAIITEGKMDAAEDLIDSIIDSGEKVLVFGSFVAPLKRLKEKYGDQAVIITGETNEDDRKNAVINFQEDDSVRLFLGGFKSAGVGITLTAAENVVFLDYSWNPADHRQAEDRAHRPGAQAQVLNIYQLHATGTIDTKLHGILEHKQKIFDRVIDGGYAEEHEDVLSEVLDDITNRVALLELSKGSKK